MSERDKHRHSPARVVKPILIKPLTPGSHRLLFSGAVTFNNGRFVINTDYSVNVGRLECDILLTSNATFS